MKNKIFKKRVGEQWEAGGYTSALGAEDIKIRNTLSSQKTHRLKGKWNQKYINAQQRGDRSTGGGGVDVQRLKG